MHILILLRWYYIYVFIFCFILTARINETNSDGLLSLVALNFMNSRIYLDSFIKFKELWNACVDKYLI
jgi:hypothetical protein